MLFPPHTEPAAWSQLCERCITLMEFSCFFYFRLGKSTVGLHLVSNPLVAFCPLLENAKLCSPSPASINSHSQLKLLPALLVLAAAVLSITPCPDPGASCACSRWSNTLGTDAKGLCSQDSVTWPSGRAGTGLGYPQS